MVKIAIKNIVTFILPLVPISRGVILEPSDSWKEKALFPLHG